MHLSAPTSNGRAQIHFKSVRFPEFSNTRWDLSSQSGINVHGANPSNDITRMYDVTYHQSENLTTHMQMDNVIIDFGLITTSGTLEYGHF